MSTSRRHNLLVKEFTVQASIASRDKKLGLEIYSEEAALVHYGHRRRDPFILSLVNPLTLESPDIINYLYYVEPDFMFFQKNEHIWNDKETRMAGYPDLVVEVWSESNTQIDREEKFLIYSNSEGKTEHWYIEQDSNVVKCYMGEDRLDDQSLERVLKTVRGIELDLTGIALKGM
jgi:Uma2 family endonuclease